MGAKFIVDRRCTVKSNLTLTGLIEAIKHRSLLRRISELAAAGSLPACDLDARVEMLLPPQAGLPAGMTIRELQDQAMALAEYRVTCRQCPSSLSGHVGGCIAYIPYPISEGVEYLLWRTAVRAMRDQLPDGLLPLARSFAEAASAMEATPFAEAMQARGELLGPRRRSFRSGPLWRRWGIDSGQVLDRFFKNGVLAGDDLRAQVGFLSAALGLAGGLQESLSDPEQRQALVEDMEPYRQVHDLMASALDQGLGVYVWP